MYFVSRTFRKANEPALIEATYPEDDRILGRGLLSDWREAIVRASTELGIEISIRDEEQCCHVAFLSQQDAENTLSLMQSDWNNWLKQRVLSAARFAYRNNPDKPEEAARILVEDYGLCYEDVKDECAPPSQRPVRMTDAYRDKRAERLCELEIERRTAGQTPGQEQDHDFD